MKTYKNDRLIEPELRLSKCDNGVNNTTLNPWIISPPRLVKELDNRTIGAKDGAYFIRCMGTKRNDENTEQTASVLILDGDSRITEDGEVLAGAPDPQLVNDFLTNLGVSHCIYSSYSNGATRFEIQHTGKDSGGLEGANFHKYRVVMPCYYNRDQLPILLDWLFVQLLESGVMLYNVKENKAWCQPWYFPRAPDQARFDLFRFYSNDGDMLDVDGICKNAPVADDDPPIAPREFKAATYTGQRINPIRLFNELSGGSVAYLMTQGYRFRGKKLIHPNSTSKEAGVQVCRNCKDGVERVYSHNGNDPLNDGFSHDAFDCYRILEHGRNLDAALTEFARSQMVNGMTLEKHNQIHWKAQQAGKIEADINWERLCLGR